MTDSEFISLITEAFQGYTELNFNGRSVYFRHLSLQDQNWLALKLENYTAKNIARGIISENERLAQLKEDKQWTSQDELSILEMQSYVDNLYVSKKKYALLSQQREAQKLIDEEEIKIRALRQKKSYLIGDTAESFAARQANEEFIRRLIYKDSALSLLAYSQEEFDNVSTEELSDLYSQYHHLMSRFSDDKIQEAVLQDFFSLYLPWCEKPWDFFGKPVVQMTVFQQKIIAWGRCFSSIFAHVDKIPDDIRKKPKELLDFADRSRNQDKIKSKNKDSSTSFIAGTKEDLEAISGKDAKIGDLAAELKNAGGYLSQDQILKNMQFT